MFDQDNDTYNILMALMSVMTFEQVRSLLHAQQSEVLRLAARLVIGGKYISGLRLHRMMVNSTLLEAKTWADTIRRTVNQA